MDHTGPTAPPPRPHSDRIARLILDSATDFAIISIDLDGNITSWNPGAEHLLGWSEAEIIGKSACIFFTDDDKVNGVCDAEMAGAARDGRAEDERWHQRKDGSCIWASGLMMRFEAEDSDEHIGYIKILRDRTPQHLAEQRLRDSERQLATALDAGRLGTWQLDAATLLLSCDDACKANFGRGAEDAFSFHALLDAVHPEHRDEVSAGIEHALASGDTYDTDYPICWPDGSEHWIHLRGTVQCAASGASMTMTGVTLEVTDRKRTEEALGELALNLEHAVDERTAALKAANDQLRQEISERQHTEETLRQAQKMEAVGQLTGGVAHDFNNLLTIIRGSTDLLQRDDVTEEKRRRYIKAISETVDRAASLTGQLLAFARRQPLKPQVFEPKARLASIDDMLRSTVGSQITIERDVAPDVWPVLADPAQFDTAMLNLTVNARDAMPEGGVLRFVARNVDQIPARRGHDATSGTFVAIEVSDTGTGISDDLIDRIYEPFFTTKDVGKGTGLGLSQVIGFAKQTGGDIVTTSDPGQGARFTLYLPRAHDEMLADRPIDAEEGVNLRGHGCILVVEDNVQVGEFATQMLHDLGFGTMWAANAQAALDLIDQHPEKFDVVFSDVVMPGMNGVELAQRLRRDHPALPVVLASGYSQVIAEEGSHGFELLQKPYSVDRVAKVLNRLMAVRG